VIYYIVNDYEPDRWILAWTPFGPVLIHGKIAADLLLPEFEEKKNPEGA
jgi:hypothetical protein